MNLSFSAHLTCPCGVISEPGSILSSSEIPINTEMCHCNPCRYSTGSLGATFPPLRPPPSEDTISKPKGYKSSDATTRYFCSKCGSHCFVLGHKQKEWYCLGGVIEPKPASKASQAPWPEDTVRVSRHDFVLDTVDGGLVPFMLTLNGRSIPTWSAAAQEKASFDLPHDTILSLHSKAVSIIPPPNEDSYLPAKCHCGGVSLLINRANSISNSLSTGSNLSK